MFFRSFYDDTGIYWALQLQKPEELGAKRLSFEASEV